MYMKRETQNRRFELHGHLRILFNFKKVSFYILLETFLHYHTGYLFELKQIKTDGK